MKLPPSKLVAIRFPLAMVEAIENAANQRKVSASDLIRAAVQEDIFATANVRRFNSLLYEVAKTRAVLCRLLDGQLDKEEVDKLLALAEDDANSYVSGRIE